MALGVPAKKANRMNYPELPTTVHAGVGRSFTNAPVAASCKGPVPPVTQPLPGVDHGALFP